MGYIKYFLACIILIPVALFSQTKSITAININPDTRTIDLPPFDEEFTINSFSTQFTSIEFKYELMSPNPNNNLYNLSGSQILDINTSTNMAHFTNIVGPLHPDKAYKFTLIGKRKISIDKAKLDVLNSESYKLIEKFFPTFRDVNPNSKNQFNTQLLALLKETANSEELYDSSDQPFRFDNVSDSYFGDAFANNAKANDAIASSRSEMNKIVVLITTEIRNASELFSQLKDIDDGKVKLSNRSIEFFSAPVNASIETNSKITLKDMLTFLLTDEIGIIRNVLSGQSKIKGTTLENSNDKVDYDSVLLLKSTLEKLRYKRIMRNDKGGKLITDSMTSALDTIIAHFNNFIAEHETNKASKAYKTTIKDKIPNILNNLFVRETININSTISIDVVADDNAYIGLDLGILFAPRIRGVFTFQSANFYFVPVNREAPFSNYQGSDKFWKRFSVYAGVAQLISDNQDDYDDLFASNSLVMGLGYRLTRTMRISAGTLMYEEPDARPLSDNSSIEFSPTIALSLDIDLTKAVGAIGTVFKK